MHGLASRQFEAGLRGAGVTKTLTGGTKRKKGQEKGREPVTDGPFSLKRGGGVGGRRELGGPAAIRQPGVLSTPTIPQREDKQAPLRQCSKLRPQTLCRVLWRLPTLARPFPRLADTGDEAEEGAEAETEGEHRRLRIREASAIKITIFSRRG